MVRLRKAWLFFLFCYLGEGAVRYDVKTFTVFRNFPNPWRVVAHSNDTIIYQQQ